MVVRTPYLLTIAFAFGACFSSAQGPTATHPAITKTPQAAAPKPYELPYIGTVNPKWTLGQNSARLLLEKPVQKELGLSDTTRQGVMKVYGDFSAKYQKLTSEDPTKADLDTEIDNLEGETHGKAVALLTPDQTVRLNQLGVQAMGLNALRLAEVRTALGLSSDQAASLDKQIADLDATEATLNADLGQQLSDLKDPGVGATAAEQEAYKKAQLEVIDKLAPRGKALDADREKVYQAFLSNLTPAQKETWETKVRGKAFPG